MRHRLRAGSRLIGGKRGSCASNRRAAVLWSAPHWPIGPHAGIQAMLPSSWGSTCGLQRRGKKESRQQRAPLERSPPRPHAACTDHDSGLQRRLRVWNMMEAATLTRQPTCTRAKLHASSSDHLHSTVDVF